MPHFITPTPTMQTRIKRNRLNAQVTITALDGLQLVTTLDPGIKASDDRIGILKRRMVYLSTARK